jgi:hypothetical protein
MSVSFDPTPPSPPPPPRPTFGQRARLFVTFLLAIGGTGLGVYTFSLLIHERHEREELEKRVAAWDPKFEKFKDTVRDIERHLSSVVYQEIDVPGTGWQPIAGGFYVIDLDLAKANDGKGSKITGKIINPTSVTHENAQLSLRVGEKKASFNLPKVPPGVAQTFEVTLPEVPPEAAKRAYLGLDSSTISFSSSTTRKGPEKGPIDTDKLLKE